MNLVNTRLAKSYFIEGRKWISIRTFHSYDTFWLNSVEEKLGALKVILYILLHINIPPIFSIFVRFCYSSAREMC